MNRFFAAVVCLSFVPSASAANRLAAELELSPDGLRAVARLSSCREYAFDWPQQCEVNEVYEMPGFSVDAKSRAITSEGAVVARWSRFGLFVRMEPSFRLRHEIVAEKAPSEAGVPVRRAKILLERVARK